MLVDATIQSYADAPDGMEEDSLVDTLGSRDYWRVRIKRSETSLVVYLRDDCLALIITTNA
jgi:hypothetical protein